MTRIAVNGDSAFILNDGDLQAEFWPWFGMLGVSLRHRGKEVLRRVEDLDTAKRKGSTAGIPLLYPWANRLASLRYEAAGKKVELDPKSAILHFDDRGLPMHGVPWGQLAWEVLEKKQNSLVASLGWDRPELLAVFPFPHRVQLTASLASDTLTLQTAVIANAGSPVPISFGFHPYLGIPSLSRSEWRLQLPEMRRLELDSRGIPTGDAESFGPFDDLLGNVSFDDGFALLDKAKSFTLSGAGRVITVSFLEGYLYSQVFTPKGKEFIALEPMTAPTNALVSAVGLRVLGSSSEFRAAFQIAIRSTE